MPPLADPVEAGVAASLARPGGNVTGLTSATAELMPKRLELLKALVPAMTRVANYANLANAAAAGALKEFEIAAAHDAAGAAASGCARPRADRAAARVRRGRRFVSYGVNYPDLYYRAAGFVDRILKGAGPASWPSSGRRSSCSISTVAPCTPSSS